MDFSSPFYTPAAASESVGESLEISSSSSAPSGLVAGQPSHEPAREEEPEPSASASTSASATTAYDQYAEMFPSLPTAAPASKPAAKSRASQGRASQASNPAKPREHTERFQIDPAQLRPSGLGDKAHTEIIRNIANDTGTKIEFSTSKNGTMTVIISGKVSEKISAAKKRVLSSLSKQYEAKIEVSREYLSAFIGKAGANLKQLQEKTGARINVPKADEQSELVTVTGDKAAVEEARKLITEFVKEKSNFVRESINIDEAFQPFVFGAGNETLKTIAQETGTKIFPPANYGESTGETEVSISGPREGVSEALKRIQTLYVEKKRSTKEVKVSVNKKQHRFVIGQKGVNINEILAKTGCTVKIPPLDDPSDSITITGDEKNLIQAVSLVFEKSNSVHLEEIQIDGEHMQRYVSQKARPAIKELEKGSKATINIAPKMIDIQGPKEDVENVRSKIINMLAGFKSLKFEEIEVAPELRKFVTGKKGQNIQKIKTEHGVDVLVPSDDEDKLPVLIAGEKSKLKAVKEQLIKPIKEVLSLPVLEFKVDPKFLWVITGAKGETIKKLSDEYESCSIRVPRADEKSDVVALRGPKEDVEKLKKHILQLVEDTRQYEITHNYKEEITVERKIVKFIAGKGGVIINRLREVHDVKIEIEESAKEEKEAKEAKEAKGKDKEAAKGKDKKEQAKEGDKEKEQAKEGEKGRPRGRGPEPMDKITIKGVKKNVEAAKEALLAKVKEISEGGDYVTIELKIDQKYHGSLIGSQGKFVKSLMDRHSIQVRFPREPPLDIVSISGLQKSVEKAKEELLELLEYEKSISHTQTVAGNNAVLKQVMGLKNTTKQRVLNIMDQTRTHIDFEGGDKEGSKLLIRGTAKGVEEAKALLTKYIEDVANSVSEEMEIDPSLHKVVIGLKGSKVREISEKHGNVDIRFPQDKTSKIVVLTGAPKDVEGAKKEITQYLSTVDAGPQSNRTVEIPQRYHGGLISYIRNNPAIKARVMFPRGGDEPDLVQVRGKDADIEEALKLMNENLEESVVVTVPTRLHRALLMGGKIKDFNVKNHVVVKFPERESPSQEVVIRGRQAVLSDAEKAFKELVAQTEKAEEARAASGAGRDRERGEGSSKDSDRKKTSIPFKPDYIGRIIGKKGANFRHISDVANVSLDVDKAKNVIHITGSAQGVELAKKELSEIIHEIESQSSEVLKVDYRFHSRLAGEGFSNINQIQDVFSVRIKLEKDREQIIVTGKAEDVKAALKYIKDSIEEMKAEHQLEHKDKPRDRDRGSRQGSSSSSSSSSSASSSSSSSGKGRAVPMNDPFFAPPPQQQQQPAPDKTSVWGTKMA